MTDDAPSPAEPRRFSRWLTLLIAIITILAVVALLLPDHVFAFAGLTSEELIQPVTARESLREAILVIAATTAVGCGLLLALFGAYGVLRRPVFLLVAILVALLIHALSLSRIGYRPDEAFTNFVYARNLAGHGQLAFNLGERAAGYGSLLLVLLLTPVALIGKASALPAVAGGIALVSSLLTLLLLYLLGRRLAPDRPPIYSLAAPLLLSLHPGYLWCAGTAIETQLVTLLVTLGAVLYLLRPAGWRWPIALAAAALTRTDAIAFLLATFAYDAIIARRDERPLRSLLTRCIPAIAMIAARVAWAATHHDGVLSSAFVASGGFNPSFARLVRGAYYVGAFLAQLGGVTLFVIPLTVAVRGFARPVAYGCILIAVGLLSVAYLGGESLPAHQLAVVVAPVLFLLLQEGGIAVYRRMAGAEPRGATAVNIILVVAFVLAYPLPYVRRELAVRREMAALAERSQASARLARAVMRDPGADVAIFGGGRVKWIPSATVVDLGGRCSRAIAKTGADAASDVLAREPAYIAINALPPAPDEATSSTALWPIEQRIEQMPEFRQQYRRVRSFAFATAGSRQLVLYRRRQDAKKLEKNAGDAGGQE